jgi:endoglycosylceramidase
VKLDKLAVLARPYPQAVAGTPRRFGFDRADRRFELEYSTARPGGGRYRFRADTQVFMPRRHYPRGYDVRVEGGQAISPRNAPYLRVRTCRGRREVGVTVTPGSGRRVADCRARRTRRR